MDETALQRMWDGEKRKLRSHVRWGCLSLACLAALALDPSAWLSPWARAIIVVTMTASVIVYAKAYLDVLKRLTASKMIWRVGQAQLDIEKQTSREWQDHWAAHPECQSPPPPSTYMGVAQ